MDYNTLTPKSPLFPELLQKIPQPPKRLYIIGQSLPQLLEKKRVAIVGSRAATPYGRRVTAEIAGQLAERGIVIISGLALGIDSAALTAAVKAGGQAIAVLPSPLDNIVPTINRRLARQIVESGGVLISEYPSGTPPLRHNFVERNRLMSGLADIVLLTEAAAKSGTLHTAEFAHQQGREVMAVPGNITSRLSEGTNKLIKDGAFPVTSYLDILHALGIEEGQQRLPLAQGKNNLEQVILEHLTGGITDQATLLLRTSFSPSQFSQAITALEMRGVVRQMSPGQWSL